jgi:hypothetical protein
MRTVLQTEQIESEFLFGREKALTELASRLSSRCSFVLHGASRTGKTFLLRHAIRGLAHVLYCSDSSTGQAVFSTLAVELLREKSRRARQFLRTDNAVKSKSTIALRGIVLEALRADHYRIVLDHLQSPAAGLSSDIRDIMFYGETPVTAVARSAHMEDLGFLAPMFVVRTDQMKLPNFGRSQTEQFAQEVARRMRLTATNLQEFLDQIVEFSQGAPGAVMTMLRMAARTKYRTEEHIKTSPLYIDFLLSWHAANAW